MRSALLVCLLTFTAASVGAAPAPQESGYTSGETRRLIADYAKCVVARHPSEASQAILSNIDNSALLDRYKMLVDGECLVRHTHANSEMRFTGDLYRYALADALVQRELADQPAPDLATVARLDIGPVPTPPLAPPASANAADTARYREALRGYDEARSYRIIAAFGECVVRVNPAGAKALILTQPTSDEEDRQFAALNPTLGQCLGEGQSLTFGKLALRGTTAVAYYRLAHAARAAQ